MDHTLPIPTLHCLAATLPSILDKEKFLDLPGGAGNSVCDHLHEKPLFFDQMQHPRQITIPTMINREAKGGGCFVVVL